jgi:hypothetical protein
MGLLLLGLSVVKPGGEAAAAPLPAQEPDPFVGNAMCVRCHQDVQQGLVAVPHGSGNGPDMAEQGCQSCHGAGRLHVQNPADTRHQPRVASLPPEGQGQLCSTCHGDMSPVDATHGVAKISCSGCHTFHRREGTIDVLSWQPNCLDCHDGTDAYDELHSYDQEALTTGSVSCTSCHRLGHGS